MFKLYNNTTKRDKNMALTKCRECNEQISKKAASCPRCGSPAKKKTSMFTWFVLFFIIFMVYTYNIDSDLGTGYTPTPTTTTPTLTPKEKAIDNMKLEFSWDKAGFDNIMEVNFTITNEGQYTVKDIEITCTHYAKSDTRIDSNERVIYDVIAPSETKKFEKFSMGFIHSQAVSSSCNITDLVIK